MGINIFTAITTVIFALAAILTYLVQRARYLREIEPDLDFEWPTSIRVGALGSTLQESWRFYIDIEVENVSKNHAEDLRYEVSLNIFPNHAKSNHIRGNICDKLRLHPHDILAGRKDTIPVYASSNLATDLQKYLNSWDSPVNVTEVGFIAIVTMSYFSRRELLLWFLFKRGRVRYTREISGMWRFLFNEKTKSYVSTPWDFAASRALGEWNIDKAIDRIRKMKSTDSKPE
jgi:hypothetical protein